MTTPDKLYPLNVAAAARTAVGETEWQDMAGLWLPAGGVACAGVVRGYLNALAVSQRAAGANMSVDVASGRAMVRGMVAELTATDNLTIAANSSGSTRIDRIVVQVALSGAASTHTITLEVLQGTPGAGAPALTQTATTWEMSLAQVSVADGASSITNANITDERAYGDEFHSLAQAAGDLVYGSASGRVARLPVGSASQVLTVSGGLPVWAGLSAESLLYDATTTVDVVSTTTETNLWSQSVPASTFAAGDHLRLLLHGDWLYNNNAGDTLTVRCKYGSTTILTTTATTLGVLRSYRVPWVMQLEMVVQGASDIEVAGEWWYSNPTTAGQFGGTSSQYFGHASIAENTATTLTMAVTAQWSASSANNSCRLHQAALYRAS